MNEAATAIVVELAREFMRLMRELEPNWSRAYYRFRSEGARYGSNASYVSDADASLIGALKWAGFYERMNAHGVELLEVLGKPQGVFLLIIDSEFNYDIRFEWENLNRWEITKLNGGAGLPQGI